MDTGAPIISLSAEEWDAMVALLDNPPAPSKALLRLMRNGPPWSTAEVHVHRPPADPPPPEPPLPSKPFGGVPLLATAAEPFLITALCQIGVALTFYLGGAFIAWDSAWVWHLGDVGPPARICVTILAGLAACVGLGADLELRKARARAG